MKVLVTGAAGFVGNHVGNHFSKMGYEVIGVDIRALDINGLFTCMEYDLLDMDWLSLLVQQQPDIIIHCAGMASVPYSVQHSEDDYQINTTMVHHMLFAMNLLQMKDVKVIFLSSAAVYGQPLSLPIHESDLCQPLSPYALHKKMSEDICEYFNRNYGFHIEVLRVFSAYGPGLKKQIFWDMYNRIISTGRLEMLGAGTESRDYIYIDDLVCVIELIIKNSDNLNQVWNVANGKEISIKSVAEMFLEALGYSTEFLSFNNLVREGDPINWKADIERIKKIGYFPKVEIKEGIRRYVEWVREYAS